MALAGPSPSPQHLMHLDSESLEDDGNVCSLDTGPLTQQVFDKFLSVCNGLTRAHSNGSHVEGRRLVIYSLKCWPRRPSGESSPGLLHGAFTRSRKGVSLSTHFTSS